MQSLIKMNYRSETDNEQLQLPECVLKSYFVRLPSGGWDVQVPEDSAMRQCFRWPIGFVTAGFVRGRQVSELFTSSFKCLFLAILLFLNRNDHDSFLLMQQKGSSSGIL